MTKQLIALGFLGIAYVSGAQTEIYLEDFDNGIPVSYTIVDNDGLTPNTATADFADAWISLPDPLDSTDTIVGSTSYFDPVGTADRWLITPQITLGTFGNYLYWDARSHDASYPDGYYVLASTSDTQLSSFTDTLLIVYAELSTWTSNSVSLSDFGLDGQSVHIAFVNRTYDGFKLYLDSISIFAEDPAGIEEYTEEQLVVSPNPTQDKAHFNMNAEMVHVYSMDGQLVLTEENVTEISMLNFPQGVYWVEVRNGAAVSRKKLVKR